MLCRLLAVTTSVALASVPEVARSYGGLVETADGKPLVSAQVIVEPIDGGSPLVTYTDSRGSFRVPSPAASAFVVRANAYGFQPQALTVDLLKGELFARLTLSPHPSSAAGTVTAQTIERRSGRQNSGWGADWSSLYSVCADAPDGYRIRSHAFRLEGDRTCGAWAECMPVEQSDARVCWGFRLQGHSEGVLFGQAVRTSEGILTATIEPIRVRGPKPPEGASAVTVYIVCSPPTVRTAIELRAGLGSKGWRVAELQSLGVRFPSRIVRAGSIEGTLAPAVARLIAAVREQSAAAGSLPTVMRLDSDAPADVVEVWLGESPRQLRSK